MKKLENMTKKELDEYGVTLGLKLDQRKKKATLIEELNKEISRIGDDAPAPTKKAPKKKATKKKVAKKRAPNKSIKEASAALEGAMENIEESQEETADKANNVKWIVIAIIVVAIISASAV